MNNTLLFTFSIVALAITEMAAEPDGSPGTRQLVCVGRVEPVDGEIEVSSQMSGTIIAVPVKEGDTVAKGAILAEIDSPREKAALDLALAQLARAKAGNGKEEVEAAEAAKDAVAAELEFAEAEYQRATKLRGQKIIAEDTLENNRERAANLRKQLASVTKQAEAMRRGRIPEEIAVAEAEATTARAAYELRLVRAQADGTILHLYRHAGDFVTVYQPSPILRMADIKHLRLRVEVSEQEVYRLREGLGGEFTVFGLKEIAGHVVIKTVLPSFAPRRLFQPDSTALLDTRTVNALCEFQEPMPPVFSGQRVIATFPLPTK